MSISSNEAAQALKEVDQARGRAFTLSGYRRSAGHFLLWGAVWVFIYVGAYLAPSHVSMIVAAGDTVGFLGSMTIAWFTRMRAPTTFAPWRTLALIATIALFLFGAIAILQPQTPAQSAALPAMIVGFMYMQMGIWAGSRFLIVGAAVMLAAIGGYFLLQDFYLVCLGVVGGGAMILTGLWLRKA
jgi:hypothetical protein